jgi:hypothetical protein
MIDNTTNVLFVNNDVIVNSIPPHLHPFFDIFIHNCDSWEVPYKLCGLSVCCWLASPWLQEHSNRKISGIWLNLSARMTFPSDCWKSTQGVLQNLVTCCVPHTVGVSKRRVQNFDVSLSSVLIQVFENLWMFSTNWVVSTWFGESNFFCLLLFFVVFYQFSQALPCEVSLLSFF